MSLASIYRDFHRVIKSSYQKKNTSKILTSFDAKGSFEGVLICLTFSGQSLYYSLSLLLTSVYTSLMLRKKAFTLPKQQVPWGLFTSHPHRPA